MIDQTYISAQSAITIPAREKAAVKFIRALSSTETVNPLKGFYAVYKNRLH